MQSCAVFDLHSYDSNRTLKKENMFIFRVPAEKFCDQHIGKCLWLLPLQSVILVPWGSVCNLSKVLCALFPDTANWCRDVVMERRARQSNQRNRTLSRHLLSVTLRPPNTGQHPPVCATVVACPQVPVFSRAAFRPTPHSSQPKYHFLNSLQNCPFTKEFFVINYIRRRLKQILSVS